MSSQKPERHHWINVFVGVLDSAFHLDDGEQFAVSDIVKKLLTQLHIPERGTPAVLPIPVVQEMYSNLYTLQLESPRTSNLRRQARMVNAEDGAVSLEAWRISLESMLLTAYPDLDQYERLLLSKVTTDLLAAIGVPNRAAAAHPPSVVATHNQLDNL